jgi:type I restriction enzyme R subunit
MEAALDRHHGSQPSGTVVKITGSIRDPRGAIRQYKNERIPSVAVTVDLLTTGVDMPKICNIVFLRRVRSRILYEQMKGRATRLCPEIEKDVFRIFDCVRLYEVLEAVDTMRPVVQQVQVSLEQLVADLNNTASFQLSAEKRSHAQDVHEQLIAKLQRLVRRARDIERFPDAAEPLQLIGTLLKQAGRATFVELPKDLKDAGPEAAGSLFVAHPQLIPLLETLREALRFGPGEMVISTHEDEIIDVGRGYGTDGKPIAQPQDYLDAFARFVHDNLNKIAALKVVTTRPRDLTREDLKALRLLLAEKEFDESRLRTAWKAARNEDIAATIIGYIRQAALGSPLTPFEERVNRALAKLKQQRPWSRNQEKWLDRLAAQLKKEIIIDDSLFDAPAFRQVGGRAALEAQFPGKVDALLAQLSSYTWDETA